MTSLSLPTDSIRRLIVRHSENGWEVASGVLSDSGATYHISEIATPGIQAACASTLFDPPEGGWPPVLERIWITEPRAGFTPPKVQKIDTPDVASP